MEHFAVTDFADAIRALLPPDNSELYFLAWRPEGGTARLCGDDAALKAAVAERGRAAGWPADLLAALAGAWIDRYPSGLQGSYAHALHLFGLAEDNWFSFERAAAASAWLKEPEYLDRRRELVVFRGVPTRGLVGGACAPRDLAVVIDRGDDCLAALVPSLRD